MSDKFQWIRVGNTAELPPINEPILVRFADGGDVKTIAFFDGETFWTDACTEKLYYTKATLRTPINDCYGPVTHWAEIPGTMSPLIQIEKYDLLPGIIQALHEASEALENRQGPNDYEPFDRIYQATVRKFIAELAKRGDRCAELLELMYNLPNGYKND